MPTSYVSSDWRTAVSRAVHLPEAQVRLKRYLHQALPDFKAPTDPDDWARRTPELRRAALERVYLRGHPAAWTAAAPRVVWGEVLRPDPAYAIRKLRYEIYPDYWIPALLYEPTRIRGKAPVVLNPNGHHAGGKAVVYKQIRCANLARRGVLALNMEFIGMGELIHDAPHHQLACFDLTGMAGVGFFYLALKKGLDCLLAHRMADRKRVAVTGLSGGGWQTIVISGLDPRVTLSVPVAGYTSLKARIDIPQDIGDLEQLPVDMGTVLDYQHLTALLAPRPALLILNENDDCCFATARARPVIYDAVRPTYRALGAEDRFETYSNRVPGTHNYDADNRCRFYRFINRHFGLAAPETDIHTEADVLPESALRVGLPPTQITFRTGAHRRALDLAARRRPPQGAAGRRRLRERIAGVIRLPRYVIRDEVICRTADRSIHRLHAGPWSIPMAMREPDGAVETEFQIADGGRSVFGGRAVSDARSTFAADIFETGENRTYAQLNMILQSAGHRTLGIQVGQILACARWIARRTRVRRTHLAAVGVAESFAALVAAALEPQWFASLTVEGHLRSLTQLLNGPSADYERAHPLYCFGFLEVADVPDLQLLLEHVSYCQPGHCLPPETTNRRTP